MAESEPWETTRVLISVSEAEYPGVQAEFEAAVARGEVLTVDDEEALNALLLEELAALVAESQQPVLSAIEEMGGTVGAVHVYLFGLDAELTPEMVESLAALDEIERMDADSEGVSSALVTGTQVIAGTQIAQLINSGNDGSYGTPNMHTAIIDQYDYHDEHPGFKDTSAAGTRIAGRFTCSSVTCTSILNFAVPLAGNPEHATMTAGLLFGDLRDAQDPVYPGANTAAQIERSGYAGEAWGYLFKLNTGLASQAIVAFDRIIALNPKPRVVVSVIGFPTDDPNCLGQSTLSRRANDLYEAGILLVQSAGNTAHPAADCTVTSPGSAIGTFTVGGHGNDTMGTELDVRQAAIYTQSARGGVSAGEGPVRE